ncbi:MAG TPA: BatA domain-containing protein, partial [Longimicrobiaceae bacterium]|nr:BatA domain-containing protein [Longimicrobiaceae bacterium]
MLQLARPALLAAGLAAALLPLLLHLVARRPPERAPLPTARFLAPDARTAVRLRRRPTDLLLLALRMLLLVLLGAAAAGPAWLPRQRGTAELVLLDRSA